MKAKEGDTLDFLPALFLFFWDLFYGLPTISRQEIKQTLHSDSLSELGCQSEVFSQFPSDIILIPRWTFSAQCYFHVCMFSSSFTRSSVDDDVLDEIEENESQRWIGRKILQKSLTLGCTCCKLKYIISLRLTWKRSMGLDFSWLTQD